MLNYRTIGAIGEAKALAKFAEYGINSYIPFNENSRSDLIVDINGELKRIQVKTSTQYSKGTINFDTDHNGTYENDVDYFVFYNLLHDELYMMDIKTIGTRKNINLSREEPVYENVTSIYAMDYAMESILEEDLHLQKMSKDVSSKICRSNNPPKIQKNKSKCPSKEKMIELLKEHKSLTPIAEMFEVSYRAVGRWCRQLEIDYHEYTDKTFIEKVCPVCGTKFKTKDRSKVYCSPECVINRALVNVNKEEAKKLYFEENWSARKLASKYGVSHGIIDKLVKKWKNGVE